MLVINSLYNGQKQGLTFSDLNHLYNALQMIESRKKILEMKQNKPKQNIQSKKFFLQKMILTLNKSTMKNFIRSGKEGNWVNYT